MVVKIVVSACSFLVEIFVSGRTTEFIGDFCHHFLIGLTAVFFGVTFVLFFADDVFLGEGAIKNKEIYNA